jgi:hypothetical protein
VRRAALVALLALAASACTIDVDIGLSLNRNNTGTVSVAVEADEEFHDLFALTGRAFEDLVASRGSTLGLTFAVENGPTTRYTAESNVVPYQTIENILEGLAPGSGPVAITATEQELRIDGLLAPLTNLDDIAVYFENEDPAQFAGDVAVDVTVTMPGEVSTSTATSQQGGQLAWSIPFSDSDTRLLARSVLEKERTGISWTTVLVIGTILLAVLFLMAIRSRLEETATVSPMRTAAAPPEPTPPATAPEDQAVGPDSRPPEDQPIAPPEETTDP